jgi:hypothetical protein
MPAALKLEWRKDECAKLVNYPGQIKNFDRFNLSISWSSANGQSVHPHTPAKGWVKHSSESAASTQLEIRIVYNWSFPCRPAYPCVISGLFPALSFHSWLFQTAKLCSEWNFVSIQWHKFPNVSIPSELCKNNLSIWLFGKSEYIISFISSWLLRSWLFFALQYPKKLLYVEICAASAEQEPCPYCLQKSRGLAW